MRGIRALVLIVAVLAATAAIMLVRSAGSPNTAASRRADTIEVLVAARAIAGGETVTQTDVKWQPWPSNALPGGSIQRPQGAAFSFANAPARFPILQGEPLAEAKLVRPGTGSAMASLLAAGMRAVPVQLREESIAGGTVQALDRVDVMLARKSREGSNAGAKGEILLHGVRVIAISKAPESRGGGGSAHSRTATLELTPGQARRLIGAQGAGDVSLALVSATEERDTGTADEFAEDEPRGVKMLKFGRRQ